ncbi:hypothetical protein ACFOZ5_08345 [Marinobacter lacisalsi]|uniref:Uncharacterized protein n=1 Tax=Marinobacter lacisalsi TaxID=475979 RepID=A0ABV8QIW2_9GAMM
MKEPSKFYSYLDEENFFKWMQSIPAVNLIEREGHHLVITLIDQDIEEMDLRDLIAVFARYQIDMGDLKKFADTEHGEWINNPDAYWYCSIFG